MLESEKLAIAAHLHVLLRRRVGRVTDVEWMVRNIDYAMEIVRVSRAEPHEDLHEWADKLEAAVLRSAPRRTIAEPPPLEASDSRFDVVHGRAPAARRYVGSLR